VSQATLRIFMDYNWPGNVRELENAIEHAFVVCNREQIEPYDLPVELRQTRYRQIGKEELNRSVSRSYRRAKIDKEELLEILNESDWNKAEAARRIGISRTAVWKYMKKYRIPLQGPA
jgi:transcriptional regulator of acetoin/glycerol metabolism